MNVRRYDIVKFVVICEGNILLKLFSYAYFRLDDRLNCEFLTWKFSLETSK